MEVPPPSTASNGLAYLLHNLTDPLARQDSSSLTSPAERKVLVLSCERSKTKSQINLDKTFGKIIHRHGGTLVLYRGSLSIEETKEMRKKGLDVPALTKLAKNGYYVSLVPMLRDAFLSYELVQINKVYYLKL
ncbi:hypothetical protein K1719_039840 [Acacia pycnantha]|nr:hypothetical protein K1719_039840 [Acacia pycnantha]